jgi:hypothetical protein
MGPRVFKRKVGTELQKSPVGVLPVVASGRDLDHPSISLSKNVHSSVYRFFMVPNHEVVLLLDRGLR